MTKVPQLLWVPYLHPCAEATAQAGFVLAFFGRHRLSRLSGHEDH